VANSGTKLHGKNGAIYLGGAKGSGGIKVAAKTEWTLQRNRDYVDATVFGDVNKTYLAGLPNVQGTFAGFLDTSGDLLLSAAVSDSMTIYLYADDDPQSITSEVLVAHGPGLIDASVNCSNTDGVRITGEFRADGAWIIDL
jgi:hypothetical protein